MSDLDPSGATEAQSLASPPLTLARKLQKSKESALKADANHRWVSFDIIEKPNGMGGRLSGARDNSLTC